MANLVKKDGNQQQEQGRGELVRWDPFQMMRDLMSFDPFQMFQNLPILRGRGREMVWNPNVEIKETDDSYVFKADVPGIKPDDLEISLTGNRLEISGKREQEREEGGEQGTYHAWERSYGSFCRTFTLPEHADLDHIKSDLKDGVLTLVVPKKAGSASQKKKIQVGSGTGAKS
jgi:HSP20 family protein